jgi:dienelactone hydrolase
MNKINNVIFQSCHGRKSVYDLKFEDDEKKKPLLIFCHGFKGFKDWGHFNLISETFAKKGLIVLKFNFTFNGGTANNGIDFPDLEAFSENNYLKEVEDINHIISLCKSSFIPLKNWNGEIYLLGHSRGGGMVTIAGSENQMVHKVVSWAGISDCVSRLPENKELSEWKEYGVRYIMNGRTKQNMAMNYQFVEVLLQNKERLSIEMAARSMDKPHLIIHGTKDEAVSCSNAESIKNWNPRAELNFIENANHVFGGKHPWKEPELPLHTANAINKTIDFLL